MQHIDQNTVSKLTLVCPFLVSGNRKFDSLDCNSGNQASPVHLCKVESWDQVCARHE